MNNNKLFLWSVVAALAGFIFGFDTVVISGADQPIQELWHTSPFFQSFFIMSMALWGTVIGAIFGGLPTEKFGRKRVLLWIGILFSLSAIGSALAPDPYIFSFFRFIGGIGIGVSSVAAPTYISEISTPKTRGRLAGMYQFNIVFGICVAYFSNYLLKGVGGENDWRWMLGVMTIPSLIYSVLVFGVPESPRWLVTIKNNLTRAREILLLIGVDDPDKEINQIIAANATIKASLTNEKLFFNKKYKAVLWLAFFVAFFNQWSGINFILYYAPRILQSAGIAPKDSLASSIAFGGTNLVFTFVGLYLIDRIGRKQLLIIGSIGYISSLVSVAVCFKFHADNVVLLSSLMFFIASHAIGQGTVIWVFISEIFPNNVRALGQSFGASTHWVFAAIITSITLPFLDSKNGIFKDNPWPIFAFFAFMMILQLVWVLTKMPETKGVSLEDLEKKLIHG